MTTSEAVVVAEEHLDEVIHDGETVAVVRRAMRLDTASAPVAYEHTVAEGEGVRATVILVHGLAQNKFTWRLSARSMVGWLAARGYAVLNVELRGHGDSRAYGAPNATSIGDYIADVAEVVRQCPQPPFLIGHSLGGAVGAGVAAQVELAGLVHLGGVYSFASDNRTLRALARLSLALRGPLMAAPVRMKTGWAGDLLGQLYQITEFAGYGFPIAGWAPDSIERELLAERLSVGFDWESVEVWLEMCGWAASGGPSGQVADFGTSRAPLLVISGDHDMLARPEDGRRCYEASGSRDRTRLVLDAFEHRVHWGHLDLIVGRHAPTIVWPIITQWMDERIKKGEVPRSSR